MYKSTIFVLLLLFSLSYTFMNNARRYANTPGAYPCPHCPRKLKSVGGRTKHVNHAHRRLTPPPDEENRGENHSFTYIRHPVLTGKPCNEEGQELPPFAPPAPQPEVDNPPLDTWYPFNDKNSFDMAYLVFSDVKMSERQTNILLEKWMESLVDHGGASPWGTATELLATIDAIQHGNCPFKSSTIRYVGDLPDNPPKWMTTTYEVHYRDSRRLLHEQLGTKSFHGNVHYTSYRQFNSAGDRVLSNLASADWMWNQSTRIAREHPDEAPGAMFLPVVAGSDKTTVSVATGHQAFHPVYMSPGILSNIARRAHGSAVLPVGFLPIPKVSKNEQRDPAYARFARQLYHACLARIFQPLKAGMTTPELIRCPDGHLRRAFYGIGPYIADYPEQVYLSGIVQGWCPKCDTRPDALDAQQGLRRSHQKTDILREAFNEDVLWDDYGIRCDYQPFTYRFPRADIHELLSPDLLHQVIKGTFKDHIVTWVYEYLVHKHGESQAKRIQQDIDRRIAAVPVYPGLRRFPEGRNFEQWTGDDSKALMKVYLACIVGYVPSRMVQCLAAFLDFCYIARQNSLSTTDLGKLQEALDRFHEYRDIFITTGVRTSISLPRQHSLVHYVRMIRLFGSPNGLCSSITESKHIVAVKKPWRVSSRYEALGQMLRRISREEKMEALKERSQRQQGMDDEMADDLDAEMAEDHDLGPSDGPKVLSSIRLAVTPASGYPRSLDALAEHVEQPAFPAAFRRFLWSQIHPDSDRPVHTVPLAECPLFTGRIKVYHSAVARFYAPSDLCGSGGMYSERIRSTPSWQNTYPRYDTVFVETDPDAPGMLGMAIGRVFLFLSFTFLDRDYSCAFIHWYDRDSNEQDPETGLWVVKPEFIGPRRSMAVINLDCVVRGAHLLPIYGTASLPASFHFSESLAAFKAFFVNRYIDHHVHEFLE